MPDHTAARRELHDVMILALRPAGANRVPMAVEQRDGSVRHDQHPLGEALAEALDVCSVTDTLVRVLRHSNCPLVAGLRTQLAVTYAEQNAPAVVRGDGNVHPIFAPLLAVMRGAV
jgi:hypothetical protein